MNHKTTILSRFLAAHAALLDLEKDVALFGIPIPEEPIATPVGDAPEALAVAAQQMEERFSCWNASLIEAEGHLEDPTPTLLEARELGRRAHKWYEASKELYLALGIRRRHEAMLDLLGRALSEAKHNGHARQFLADRGIFVSPPTTAVAKAPRSGPEGREGTNAR